MTTTGKTKPSVFKISVFIIFFVFSSAAVTLVHVAAVETIFIGDSSLSAIKGKPFQILPHEKARLSFFFPKEVKGE